ncbi:hypothetical protein BGZ95_007610 [Linnemannia exigua]|uniref:Uncharacterized protein n=1 Tax=Linnemannia exigua TaxID=604196 RepID=A0AAD4DEW7_9FUNG|nr:hypothetical protein BGZ95_007610 [Linnemannia exigua]
MDPLSQLPIECLHIIINNLVQAENSTALARLLRTNKYLSSVTLPFLYSDPFDLRFHEQTRFYFNADVSGFILTRMLLRRPAVVETLPKILKVALTASDSYYSYDDELDFDLFGRVQYDSEAGSSEQDFDDASSGQDFDDTSSEEDFDVASPEGDFDAASPEGDFDTASLEGDFDAALPEGDFDAASSERDFDATLSERDSEVDSFTLDSKNGLYDKDDIETVTPSSLDYLGQIRKLHICKWQIEIEKIWPENGRIIRRHTSFKKFIYEDEDEQQRSAYFKGNLREHYNDLLYLEALWVLANPILEQLQSIHIPIYDVERYLGVIGRLSRMESVRFVMWEPFDYPESVGMASSPDFAQAATTYKQQLLRTMINFVKEHARLFPGQLRRADLFGEKPALDDDRFWRDTPATWRKDTQFELYGILPPLFASAVLSQGELIQCLAHPTLADVSRVKDIVLGEPPARWFEQAQDTQQLLQRCRSLKSLHMADPPSKYFKWAVEKRRRMDNASRDTTITSSNLDRRQEPSEQNWSGVIISEDALPPLSSITLMNKTSSFVEDLNDIAYAFSQTLQRIFVFVTRYQPSIVHSIAVYGRGWVCLPMLTELFLDVGHDRLLVDHELLTYCPNVTKVVLQDQTSEYRCQDVEPCSPAQLSKVEVLNLIGWTALTFHPATLYSTPQLTELKIMTLRLSTNRQFIPPLEELYRSYGFLDESSSEPAPTIIRPYWTWDWHLPQLRTLCLTGEFAFHFQFRMLLGCPALVSLYLDMGSCEQQHTRVLTGMDFMTVRRNTSVSPTDDSATSSELIVAPNLRELTMLGFWVVPIDEVFLAMLLGMFPRLEKMREEMWSGYTLKGVLNGIRGMPIPLSLLQLDVPDVGPEERGALGLLTHYGGACIPGLLVIGIGRHSVSGDRSKSYYTLAAQ